MKRLERRAGKIGGAAWAEPDAKSWFMFSTLNSGR
jgi:hypothetical protein